MATGKKTAAGAMRGMSKANFTKKTKSGGTLTLHAKKGTAGVAVYRKAYKIEGGKRRILVMTTVKKVIK